MGDTNPVGRPTKFKDEYCEQVEKLGKLGATDKEIADFFNVDESTINNWKIDFPEFLESIKKGKTLADANVADSLYKRALGYEHPEDDIKVVDKEIVITPTIKHYPPDSTAMIFWLKNRRSKEWRDKQEIEQHNTGLIAHPSSIENLSFEQLLQLANAKPSNQQPDSAGSKD